MVLYSLQLADQTLPGVNKSKDYQSTRYIYQVHSRPATHTAQPTEQPTEVKAKVKMKQDPDALELELDVFYHIAMLRQHRIAYTIAKANPEINQDFFPNRTQHLIDLAVKIRQQTLKLKTAQSKLNDHLFKQGSNALRNKLTKARQARNMSTDGSFNSGY